MSLPKRAPLKAALFLAAIALAGCGLGRDQNGGGAVSNPIVAATVNGRRVAIGKPEFLAEQGIANLKSQISDWKPQITNPKSEIQKHERPDPSQTRAFGTA